MTVHPAGPGGADSGYLLSRRRMLRAGTATVAATQVMGLAYAAAVARSWWVVCVIGGALAASAAHAATRRGRTARKSVAAWLTAGAAAAGALGYSSTPGAAAGLVVPLALVGAVVLPVTAFAAVAAATEAAVIGGPAAAGWPPSQIFLVAGGYAAAAVLALAVAREQRRLLRARSGQALEARARTREVDLLLTVARTLRDADDEEVVTRQVLELVCSFVGAGAGALARFDTDAGRLVGLTPTVGGAAPALAEAPGAEAAWRSGQPVVDGDTMFVRLEFEGRRLGVMAASDPRPGVFSDSDAHRFNSLAAQAALVLDHTHRYNLERVANERLAELAQLKADFVAGVSHDLRTPITTIVGALATVMRPELAHPDERARRLLAAAARNASRLHSLIEDLLVVSSIEAGVLLAPGEPIDVEALAREVVDEIVTPSPLHEGRVEVPPGLAPLEADRETVRRVLVNLAENAVKYTAGGTITISAATTGAGMRIVVADEGPGIPAAGQERLFQRFSRLEPETARGTGLGLYIVANLVTAMGGWVMCCSGPGFGTRFGVVLPRAPVAAAPQQAAAPPAEVTG